MKYVIIKVLWNMLQAYLPAPQLCIAKGCLGKGCNVGKMGNLWQISVSGVYRLYTETAILLSFNSLDGRIYRVQADPNLQSADIL